MAAAGALAVGTWLTVSPLAAQEDKPSAGAKDQTPAAPAPKSDAPKSNVTKDRPQQAPRPSATAPNRPQPAQQQPAQRPQTSAPDQPAEAADRAADQARDRASQAKEQARDQADRARDTARDARDDARGAADRNRDADRTQDGPTRHQTNRAFSSGNDRRGDQDHGDRARRDGDRHHRAFTKVGININAVNNGLAITSVVPNSVFATVGFRTGDVLVSVGGRRLNDTVLFYDWLRTVRPGERVAIVVLRDGQQQTLYWTPAEQWVEEFATVVEEGAPASDSFLGIHLDPQVQDAAIVADVDPNSPAARAGVRRNDAIDSVNGEQIRSADDFVAATSQLPPGEAVQMTISRLMNVQIVPGGGSGAQTTIQRQETYVNPGAVNPAPAAVPAQPAPPAVVPAPTSQVPAAAPQPREERRGGLFRRR